jgi:hypothetical protein
MGVTTWFVRQAILAAPSVISSREQKQCQLLSQGSPRVPRTARGGTAILSAAPTDPTHLGQAGAELDFWLSLQEEMGLIQGIMSRSLGDQSLQAFHAWNPGLFRDGIWGTLDPVLNWWNLMETTFGATFGGPLSVWGLA